MHFPTAFAFAGCPSSFSVSMNQPTLTTTSSWASLTWRRRASGGAVFAPISACSPRPRHTTQRLGLPNASGTLSAGAAGAPLTQAANLLGVPTYLAQAKQGSWDGNTQAADATGCVTSSSKCNPWAPRSPELRRGAVTTDDRQVPPAILDEAQHSPQFPRPGGYRRCEGRDAGACVRGQLPRPCRPGSSALRGGAPPVLGDSHEVLSIHLRTAPACTPGSGASRGVERPGSSFGS